MFLYLSLNLFIYIVFNKLVENTFEKVKKSRIIQIFDSYPEIPESQNTIKSINYINLESRIILVNKKEALTEFKENSIKNHNILNKESKNNKKIELNVVNDEKSVIKTFVKSLCDKWGSISALYINREGTTYARFRLPWEHQNFRIVEKKGNEMDNPEPLVYHNKAQDILRLALKKLSYAKNKFSQNEAPFIVGIFIVVGILIVVSRKNSKMNKKLISKNKNEKFIHGDRV